MLVCKIILESIDEINHIRLKRKEGITQVDREPRIPGGAEVPSFVVGAFSVMLAGSTLGYKGGVLMTSSLIT